MGLVVKHKETLSIIIFFYFQYFHSSTCSLSPIQGGGSTKQWNLTSEFCGGWTPPEEQKGQDPGHGEVWNGRGRLPSSSLSMSSSSSPSSLLILSSLCSSPAAYISYGTGRGKGRGWGTIEHTNITNARLRQYVSQHNSQFTFTRPKSISVPAILDQADVKSRQPWTASPVHI